MKLLLSWLMILALVIYSGPDLLAQAPAITRNTLRRTPLRVAPDSNARIRQRLPRGRPLRVRRCANGWCRVTTRNIGGWVRRADIESYSTARERNRRARSRRTVVLYADRNFRGRRDSTFAGLVPRLPAGLEDEVSSLVIRGDVWVTFWDERNHRNSFFHAQGPLRIPDLSRIRTGIENAPNWDDLVRSYRVHSEPPKERGTICTQSGCTYRNSTEPRPPAPQPPPDDRPGSGNPSFCFFVARVDVDLQIYVENAAGRKGALVEDVTLRRGERHRVNSPNGRMRFDYRVDERNAFHGDVATFCRGGAEVAVP